MALPAAVAVLVGCSHPSPPVGPPHPSGSAGAGSVASTGASPADDPPGALTCARLEVALRRATLMSPSVVDGIVAASATADAPVADAAQRLAAAYAKAVAARGAAQEPDAVAAVSAAASDMSGVCRQSGLATVG